MNEDKLHYVGGGTTKNSTTAAARGNRRRDRYRQHLNAGLPFTFPLRRV